MPEEEKRDDNLHEFDKEPATGGLNDESSNDTPNDSTEQRASSAWGSSKHTELKTDETDSSNTDLKNGMSHDDESPINPLHTDIAPATIPMSTRRPGGEPGKTTKLDLQEELPKPGPGLMVLQWLTYAFWGWTVLSLSGLVLIVVAQLLNQSVSDWTGGIAYLLAAVIVLFIISLVTDLFYANAEKKHARTVGTNVIMIIHAVLFALFAIGSLIAAVFGLVSLLINDTSGSAGPLTTIISGGIIAVLYGLTLLRTLRPRWLKAVVPVYWAVMSLAVIITIALAIAGPVAQARLQNEDKVVELGTPIVAEAISSYTNHQGKLPSSLADLSSVPADGQKLIDEHKITYQPGEKVTPPVKKFDIGVNPSTLTTQTPVYHYTLCVDYKAKDDSPDYMSYRASSNDQRYPTNVSTYGHKAGHVCYDLQTDYIYSY